MGMSLDLQVYLAIKLSMLFILDIFRYFSLDKVVVRLLLASVELCCLIKAFSNL